MTTRRRHAQTVTAFIAQGTSSLTLEQLETFPKRVPQLRRKLAQVKKNGHAELHATAERLLNYALAALEGHAVPFHPRTMFGAIFALTYLLKGYDAIPDSVPGIGMADDLIILRQVTKTHADILTAFEGA
jgi:uncharacterized membrane protein YkvA (DUF1232 family)